MVISPEVWFPLEMDTWVLDVSGEGAAPDSRPSRRTKQGDTCF
jgi:hypothetical protein